MGRHTSAPTSNRVLVRRTAEDRYLALVDQEVERGEPVGDSPLANFWNHPELEPFCIYDRPRDSNLKSHPAGMGRQADLMGVRPSRSY